MIPEEAFLLSSANYSINARYSGPEMWRVIRPPIFFLYIYIYIFSPRSQPFPSFSVFHLDEQIRRSSRASKSCFGDGTAMPYLLIQVKNGENEKRLQCWTHRTGSNRETPDRTQAYIPGHDRGERASRMNIPLTVRKQETVEASNWLLQDLLPDLNGRKSSG